MEGMAFQPATVAAAPGDTLVFTNHDLVPHTATSRSFDTGAILQDSTARHVVTAADTGNVSCTFHPVMKLRISPR